MAQGAKTKEEIVKESMDSPKVIDTSVEFDIPLSPQKYIPSKHTYKCFCCGKGFNGAQKANFQRTNSPLFQSNNGFLPWCKECTDKYVTLLVRLYSKNEEHAIEHFCEQVDWCYDLEPLKCAREISSDRSRISHYAAKKNLNVGGRKTYIDSLKFAYEKRQGNIITSKEQVKSDKTTVTASAVDRWGIGFEEMDYKNLDEHYRLLKKNNPCADNNQEIFIKSLCNLNMLMIKSLQAGDSKEYSSLVEKYSKTFNQAGLRAIEEKDNSNNETVGVTLATISQFTPEEFYKDKKLFEDTDNIGDYYDRHICRPMKNLMFDQDVRDKEFFVKDGDIEDDD